MNLICQCGHRTGTCSGHRVNFASRVKRVELRECTRKGDGEGRRGGGLPFVVLSELLCELARRSRHVLKHPQLDIGATPAAPHEKRQQLGGRVVPLRVTRATACMCEHRGCEQHQSAPRELWVDGTFDVVDMWLNGCVGVRV